MKISKENIQFIMSYLNRHDVEYFDYRVELLDHLASDIENSMKEEEIDFHQAFVQTIHKNKQFIKSKTKISLSLISQKFSQYFKNFRSPITLILFLISFGFLHFYLEFYPITVVKFIVSANCIVLLPVLIYTIYSFKINQRFSAVEYSFYINSLIQLVFLFLNIVISENHNSKETVVVQLFLAFYLTFQLLFLKAVFSAVKKTKYLYGKIEA